MPVLLKSIRAHTDKVWSLSSHQTLPLLASGSSDKCSKIYKLSEEQNFPEVGTLEETHQRSVRCVSFKPQLQSSDHDFVDLPALASGSFDATISVWGIDEPAELLEEEDDDDDDDSDAEARRRREAELLCSAKNEWNLMALIEGHENEVKAVAWNRSGKYLASCSRDKTIWIWETDPESLEDFECISVISDHEHDIKHIVWHAHVNLLASSSYDDTVRLYMQDADDEDWTCVAVLNGHAGTVWCSQFEHPDAPGAQAGRTRLVSVSDDSTARVWASSSPAPADSAAALPSSIKHSSAEMQWELQQVLPPVHKYAVYSVAWSARTGRVATAGADGQIAVYTEAAGRWEVESVVAAAHGVYEVNCVTWCVLSNGKEVLVSAGDDGCINVWE